MAAIGGGRRKPQVGGVTNPAKTAGWMDVVELETVCHKSGFARKEEPVELEGRGGFIVAESSGRLARGRKKRVWREGYVVQHPVEQGFWRQAIGRPPRSVCQVIHRFEGDFLETEGLADRPI